MTDSAVSSGGDANNVSNNELHEGSAASAGGDAHGYSDQSTDVDIVVKDSFNQENYNSEEAYTNDLPNGVKEIEHLSDDPGAGV